MSKLFENLCIIYFYQWNAGLETLFSSTTHPHPPVPWPFPRASPSLKRSPKKHCQKLVGACNVFYNPDFNTIFPYKRAFVALNNAMFNKMKSYLLEVYVTFLPNSVNICFCVVGMLLKKNYFDWTNSFIALLIKTVQIPYTFFESGAQM